MFLFFNPLGPDRCRFVPWQGWSAEAVGRNQVGQKKVLPGLLKNYSPVYAVRDLHCQQDRRCINAFSHAPGQLLVV